ncbi:MAG: LarC family nickel insertion protein [Deltaproteobacteria bacterium]|jgi:uncharacterized protein (DUF111 family)|nr:LarC family nickel insertion protein [Deltaproteobacteria bacterium]
MDQNPEDSLGIRLEIPNPSRDALEDALARGPGQGGGQRHGSDGASAREGERRHHRHHRGEGERSPSDAPEARPGERPKPDILVLRPHSGISGDIMVAGLAALLKLTDADFDEALRDLGLPELRGKVRLEPRSVAGVGGHGLFMELPEEKESRDLADVSFFLEKAAIPLKAKELALTAFEILAEAEGQVHGLPPRDVHFHEVGALDSLLDAGLAALFFERLSPRLFVSGPLPLCDGVISCAHGLLPSPAPAVAKLLRGVKVRGLRSSGETVTPTGIALLKAFGARFGDWPEMTVRDEALVYGGRLLPGVPNGALFAWGGLI